MTQPLTADDPRSLGVYELLGRLGEGAQGVVYLGRSPQGEQVAIKLLHPGLASEPQSRDRFFREVAVAQRVARFCTAAVLHADLAGSRPYVVSEYIAGPSLRTLVEREGPRRGAALERLAISTATALAAIHRAGVLHRDFKPANVLVGPEGPVVIDFGIARALDVPGNTRTGTAMGTPSYLAPEILAGQPATPASDVFSWGVTMVYAATARPAFGNDSIATVVTRILHEEPDLTQMEPPLRDLVAACLNKDPAQRPTAEQLVTALTGQPAPPPPVAAPPPPRTPATPRRGGMTIGISVGVGAVVLAAAAVVFTQSQGQRTVTHAQTPAAAQHAVATASPTPEPAQPTVQAKASKPAKRRSPRPEPQPTYQTYQPQPVTTVTVTPTKTLEASPTPTRKRRPKPTVTVHKPSQTPTPTPSQTRRTQEPPPPQTTPNPHTPEGVCGSGYKVIDQYAYGNGGTTYLLWNASAGMNCVVTLSTVVHPNKVAMSAVLQVKGGASKTSSGNFTVYAGPIRLAAAKKCVIWGGSFAGQSWKSGWSHCS